MHPWYWLGSEGQAQQLISTAVLAETCLFGLTTDAQLGHQSRKTCKTSERNSRPYKINTTNAVAKTNAVGEKNQAIAANEK
jgi:hypothetical protein